MKREQWEKHCLEHIREKGNTISIFWATDNQFRAYALERLIQKGIIEVIPLQFPISKVKIIGD